MAYSSSFTDAVLAQTVINLRWWWCCGFGGQGPRLLVCKIGRLAAKSPKMKVLTHQRSTLSPSMLWRWGSSPALRRVEGDVAAWQPPGHARQLDSNQSVPATRHCTLEREDSIPVPTSSVCMVPSSLTSNGQETMNTWQPPAQPVMSLPKSGGQLRTRHI